MNPIFCQVKHDPEAGTYGDCLRACVASVLDRTDVPHFFHDGCDGPTGNRRLRDWLRPYGYAPYFANYPGSYARSDLLDMMEDLNPDTVYILYGSTIDGDHVVVCKGGTVEHDPAWVSSPLVGPGSHGYWTILVIAVS